MAKKKTYGVFNNTIKPKYGIMVLDAHSINKGCWVTDVTFKFSSNPFPKGNYEIKKGEHAWFTDERETAEQIATLMNVEMVPAFVVAVPDFYCKDFINQEEYVWD